MILGITGGVGAGKSSVLAILEKEYNAKLILGNKFRCNYSTTIDCSDADIKIGNNVVLGWNVTIKNND